MEMACLAHASDLSNKSSPLFIPLRPNEVVTATRNGPPVPCRDWLKHRHNHQQPHFSSVACDIPVPTMLSPNKPSTWHFNSPAQQKENTLNFFPLTNR